MGGRGTFASGVSVDFKFKTIKKIHGIKVLDGHGFPEESHSSSAYIKLHANGTFKELRIFSPDHYAVKDIAYHPEPNLNNGDRDEKILHAHDYPIKDNFNVRSTRLLTKDEYKKYKKYFIGVPKYDEW